MKKAELVKAIAKKAELTKKEVEAVFKAFEEIVNEELITGKTDYISVGELGRFVVVEVPEKKARNPRTGEEITIPAYKKLKFKVSKAYRKL